MPNNEPEQIQELKNLIAATDDLKDNAAVNDAVKEIDEAVKKEGPDYFKEVMPAIKGLYDCIKTITKPGISGVEVATAVVSMTEKLFTSLGKIPGFGIVTGPISKVLKLVGAVLGAFGKSSKKNGYSEMRTEMNRAIGRIVLDSADTDLSGTLKEMSDNSSLLDDILATKHKDPTNLLNVYTGFTVGHFNNIASKEIGAAYTAIAKNVPNDMHENWSAAAETFYNISDLVSFKIQYMLQGISFFQLAEGSDESEDSRANTLSRQQQKRMSEYYSDSCPYFERPGIQTAGITHWIYRMDKERFQQITSLNNCLSDSKAKYFEYRQAQKNDINFKCSDPDKHANRPQSGDCYCVRMVTLYANRDKDKQDKHGKYNDNMMLLADQVEVAQRLRLWQNSMMFGATGSHFAIAVPDSNGQYNADKPANNAIPPYQRLALDTRSMFTPSNMEADKTPKGINNTVYIFRVYPTDEEIKNRNKNGGRIWPNDWSRTPDTNRPLYMAGKHGGDIVLCDHNGSGDLKQEPYHKIVYDSSHYGSPEHCLWYFMEENER